MKALEAEIGVRLFDRRPRGLELTAAGEAIAHRVNQAILEITRAVAELKAAPETHKLRVTMLPSVASRWLMPRLSIFQQQHPNIQVQVIADARVLDLRAEGIHLAIRFGHGRYRSHSSTLLMEDHVLPVCSPQLIANRNPIKSIEALFELPLLHDAGAENDGSLSDWHGWLDQLGRTDLACHAGQRFSHAGLLIEAAVHGLGVALARLSLVTDHLATGALVSPLPLTTPTAFRYYLVAVPERVASNEVAVFSEWLRQEALKTDAWVTRVRDREQELGYATHRSVR